MRNLLQKLRHLLRRRAPDLHKSTLPPVSDSFQLDSAKFACSHILVRGQPLYVLLYFPTNGQDGNLPQTKLSLMDGCNFLSNQLRLILAPLPPQPGFCESPTFDVELKSFLSALKDS